MKRLISALATIMAIGTPANSQVMLSYMMDSDHQTIWNNLIERGVSVHVNEHTECKTNEILRGMYYGAGQKPRLDICQEWAHPGIQVEWTEKDLHALRHEAFHYVQDCIDGTTDHKLNQVFDTDKDRENIRKGLGTKVDLITKIYKGKYNVSDEIYNLELEAHWAADWLLPEQIASLITKHCTVK